MDRVTELWSSIPLLGQVVLATVGAVYLASAIFNTIHFLLHTFILSGINLRKYGKKGTWAVVTGASDGLGKEFATQLATRGFNIVLVSRTQSKLENLASVIEARTPGVQTKVLAMDYEKNDDADYERMAQLISGLDVGILVNNVGRSHNIPVPFLETDGDELENIVTINCLGTLKTTKVVAPLLVQRKKGLILSVGSFSALLPTPFLATYSGSKAFLQFWSSSLAAELKPQGVDVHLIISYLVATGMAKRRRATIMIPSPKDFVRSALRKIGLSGPHNIPNTYTPQWSHGLLQWVIEVFTGGARSSFAIDYNLKAHADIRRRALRKAAREAKKA